MTKLFGRDYRVIVSTIEIRSLDLSFTIAKSLKPEPNTCELKIWNLNETNRSRLEEMKTAPVSVEAGYEDGMSLLFLGDLRTAISTRDGPDIVTTLASGDGEKAYRKARCNVSLAKGTSIDAAVKSLTKQLGLSQGNVDEMVAGLKFTKNGQLLSQGTVLTGSAARELTALLKSVGLTWSIQDGKVQLLELGKALAGQAIYLTRETGLIGSPTIDNKGVMSCRMLMIPDVFPGRLMVLKAERISGQFRIDAAKYSGDTFGTNWYIDVEAKRY
jgi:hypothetical protein